jgi:hypothetical protein
VPAETWLSASLARAELCSSITPLAAFPPAALLGSGFERLISLLKFTQNKDCEFFLGSEFLDTGLRRSLEVWCLFTVKV